MEVGGGVELHLQGPQRKVVSELWFHPSCCTLQGPWWGGHPSLQRMGHVREKVRQGGGYPRPEIWVMTGPEGLTTDQFLELWKSPREEETQDFIIFNGKYRKEIMLKTDSWYCSRYWDLTSGR